MRLTRHRVVGRTRSAPACWKPGPDDAERGCPYKSGRWPSSTFETSSSSTSVSSTRYYGAAQRAGAGTIFDAIHGRLTRRRAVPASALASSTTTHCGQLPSSLPQRDSGEARGRVELVGMRSIAIATERRRAGTSVGRVSRAKRCRSRRTALHPHPALPRAQRGLRAPTLQRPEAGGEGR